MKLSTLLTELAAMRASDPPRKAVVFSSWSRLLQLVETALHDNGIVTARFWGGTNASRAAALRRFRRDPLCTVILIVMSTSGLSQLPFVVCAPPKSWRLER
jgi:E3 ubiquitin-protein ligase SHPRH